MLESSNAAIGRFDKSFLIHMIKDFFLVLVAVTVLEFSLKALTVYANFATAGEDEARLVAEDLAENVRSIMRNEGGPVAARTMYPILERNWSDLGYVVAIEPSEVTIRSIEQGFGFTPLGIPAQGWPDGSYKQARIEIEAESFCLGCHTEAEVGQTLGAVTVRNYLARDFALWVEDVQLTAALSVGKIVLHSVLLFLILRARLEPLNGLRTTVSTLARAYGGLDHRAQIRTADEFGVLARDLNLFLDRISRIVGELDAVLGRIVSVNDDIVTIQADLRDQIDGVVSRIRRLEREAMLSAKREPRLSNAWFDAVRGAIAALDRGLAATSPPEGSAGETPAGAARSAAGGATAGATGPAGGEGGGEVPGRVMGGASVGMSKGASGGPVGEPAPPEAAALVESLRAVVADAEAQVASSERVFEGLAALGEDSEGLKGAMAEMTRLEERMKGIIESCGQLVGRLRPGRDTGEA